MSRTMTGEEFAEYARSQIMAASVILDQHQPHDHGFCSCGRALPCDVRQACNAKRDHFSERLALLGMPREPLLRPAPEQQHRRRIMARLRARIWGGGTAPPSPLKSRRKSMRWWKPRQRKKTVIAKGTVAPLHGIACRCAMCGFTGLLDVVPMDRPFTRHISHSMITRARLVVSAPE